MILILTMLSYFAFLVAAGVWVNAHAKRFVLLEWRAEQAERELTERLHK